MFSQGKQFIYLTIDNKVTTSSRKVHVNYIKVYNGTEITIRGLEKGWVIELYDKNNKLLYSKTAEDSTVKLNILDYIIENGMPLKGYITIKMYNTTELEKYGGFRLKPGEIKVILLSIKDIPPGEYTIKTVTKRGAVDTYKIRIS